jgi:hypothetical protein
MPPIELLIHKSKITTQKSSLRKHNTPGIRFLFMTNISKVRLYLLAMVFLPLSAITQENPFQLDFASIDKKALAMPESAASGPEAMAAYFMAALPTDVERTRAAFVWIATHIDYETNRLGKQEHYKKEKELVDRVLRKRKGLCGEYAALFKALCTAMDIPVETVVGYTRTLGKLDTVPHAWNAVMLDSAWYLVDATWGAGHLNGRRFIRELDNTWFLTAPETFIESHMPFNPMWQLLHAPVSYRSFAKGNHTGTKTDPPFQFRDTIAHYRSLDALQQTHKTYETLQNHTQENIHLRRYVREVESELDYYKNTSNQDRYNEAVDAYNAGIDLLNTFLVARNQQTVRPENKASHQTVLQQAMDQFQKADAILTVIKDPEKRIRPMVEQTTTANRRAMADAEAQLKWLSNKK